MTAAFGYVPALRLSLPAPTPHGPVVWARRSRRRRRVAPWLLGGLLALAALLFVVWRFTPLFAGGPGIPTEPTAVARLLLEPAGDGTAVAFVLTDRLGRDAGMTGEVSIEVREPDGQVWRFSTFVTPASFTPLPRGSLLSGRIGYRVVIPPTAWTRPPRRGGQATVAFTANPQGMPPISVVANDIFP